MQVAQTLHVSAALTVTVQAVAFSVSSTIVLTYRSSSPSAQILVGGGHQSHSRQGPPATVVVRVSAQTPEPSASPVAVAGGGVAIVVFMHRGQSLQTRSFVDVTVQPFVTAGRPKMVWCEYSSWISGAQAVVGGRHLAMGHWRGS